MADQIVGVLSPFLRRRRIAAARPHIRGKVLDYGCGIGHLGDIVSPHQYTGVDLDRASIEIARRRNAKHKFETLAEFKPDGQYDTIVSLAVIEHVSDPSALLKMFHDLLAPAGQIVLTIPNPALEWAHGLGAALGLFSKEGHEEHQSFLRKADFGRLALENGLDLKIYRRFLLGANQLVVYRQNSVAQNLNQSSVSREVA